MASFTAGTGAVFELRVDDAASTVGRARATLRSAEAGSNGVQAAITGIFRNLSPGPHTASMWVRTSAGGSAANARLDTGCWSSDVLIVREFTPLGMAYLPSVSR